MLRNAVSKCQAFDPTLSYFKAKVPPLQATKAFRAGRGIALPYLIPRHWRWGGGQHHAPAALPPGKTRYPLYRRLGGSQGWSGWVRKISPTPWFDPRTVQPVASRYIDWAIPAALSHFILVHFWRTAYAIRHLHPAVSFSNVLQSACQICVMSGSVFVWTVVCAYSRHRELWNIGMNRYKCDVT